MTVVKNLPVSEDGHGVVYRTKAKEYIVSQNTKKEIFTLWLVVDGGYEKIATSNNPIKLYEKV